MEATRKRWPWITLIVLQVVQLLSLVPWLLMAGLSFMVFDAPGSDKMWQPWAFVIAIWSYPIWLLLAGVISWLLFYFRRYLSAVVLSAVVTLPAPALLLFLALQTVS